MNQQKATSAGATLVEVPNGALAWMIGGKMIGYCRNPAHVHVNTLAATNWDWVHKDFRK